MARHQCAPSFKATKKRRGRTALHEMSESGQPDGYYPRLNGEMMRSGKFVGSIVSMVGHFDNSDSAFRCCDGNVVQISTDMVAEMPETRDPKMAVELVGQISSPDLLSVRT